VNPQNVNIKDVARLAQVSPTTVSHALGGARRVSEATRRRVLEAADLLGYRPHPGARSLKAGSTGVLGLCMVSTTGVSAPFAEMEYYFRLVTAATAAAMAERFALVVVPETDAGAVWDRLLLDGAIIVDPVRDDPNIRRLRARRLPYVTVGRDPDAPGDGCWVDADPEAAARLCLDHLVARGARNVAGLAWDTPDHWTQASLRTYRDWCTERGQKPQLTIVPEDSTAALRQTAVRLLTSRPRPDAVYSFFEQPALHVLAVAAEMGVAVPADLMVASPSDSGLAPTASPPMTTLDYHAEEHGREAARMLVNLVRGVKPAEPRKLITLSLVERESTRRA
jgi:DNA-binding LacI/PurR family transcriptional regulator